MSPVFVIIAVFRQEWGQGPRFLPDSLDEGAQITSGSKLSIRLIRADCDCERQHKLISLTFDPDHLLALRDCWIQQTDGRNAALVGLGGNSKKGVESQKAFARLPPEHTGGNLCNPSSWGKSSVSAEEAVPSTSGARVNQ